MSQAQVKGVDQPGPTTSVFIACGDVDQTLDSWLGGVSAALLARSLDVAALRRLPVPLMPARDVTTLDPDDLAGFLRAGHTHVVFVPTADYGREAVDRSTRLWFVERVVREWLLEDPARFARCTVVSDEKFLPEHLRVIRWMRADYTPARAIKIAEAIADVVGGGPDPALNTPALLPLAVEPALSDGLGVVLAAAQWIAAGSPSYRKVVTPEALFVALVHVGRCRPRDNTSAAWIAKHTVLGGDGEKRWSHMLRRQFPSWEHQRHTAAFAEGNAIPDPDRITRVEFSMESLWMHSWGVLLARRLGSDKAQMAHLFVSMMRLRAPWTEAVVAALTQLGVDLLPFRQSVEHDVRSWDIGWDNETWTIAVGGAAPFRVAADTPSADADDGTGDGPIFIPNAGGVVAQTGPLPLKNVATTKVATPTVQTPPATPTAPAQELSQSPSGSVSRPATSKRRP